MTVDAIKVTGLECIERLDRQMTGDRGNLCEDDCQTLEERAFLFLLVDSS
jgi:hypothetical protein